MSTPKNMIFVHIFGKYLKFPGVVVPKKVESLLGSQPGVTALK